MRFDLTDLRLFINVCDAGQITAGAERSRMSIQAASERIRGMEDRLGLPLLVRETRGISLTDAGRALQTHARRILDNVEDMHAELGQMARGPRGHVRVLANAAALADYLPEVLSAFLREHAHLSLDVEERGGSDIVRALSQQTADLGVLTNLTDLQGLQSLPVREDPLVLAVPADHALADAVRVRLDDIAGFDFVGLAHAHPLQEHIETHMRRHGQRPAYRVRLSTLDAVCRMVVAGAGLALVPRTALERARGHGALRALAFDEPWAERWLVVCARDFTALSAHAQALVAALTTPATDTDEHPAL